MPKPKLKIKRDDNVVVTTGDDAGKVGRVLRVIPTENRLVVEKVNLVKRQMKPQGERPGGTVEKEASIAVSNVAYWNAAESRAVKVGWSVVDGKKVRVDRKTGAPLDK